MFYFDYTWLLLIPGLIIAAIAQAKVKRAYNTYSNVPVNSGLTGAMAARKILDANGLGNVRIQEISGKMTDHYDPRSKVMSLSSDVARTASVAAVGIAAHETGHAIQDAQSYAPLRFRNAIVPVCNITSHAAWPLFFVGLIFSRYNSGFGSLFMDLGIVLFSIALVFYLITLPVEFNASSRAVETLKTYQIVAPEEAAGVRKVLSAAAMTYVASTLMVILQLLRMLAIRGRN